ncbi:MAG: amidohydrolase [Chthonomonas sp.]|nr:amidohydrolase [Chthonomonas sp.]
MRIGGFQRYDAPGQWWLEHDNDRIMSVEPDTGQPRDEEMAGKYLLPSYIDAHCHILPTGLGFLQLQLGEASTPDQVLDLVRDFEKTLPPGKWLQAMLYDQTKFPDGQHLHRDQLDAINRERPILLRHVNGHASIANSAALQQAGVTRETPNPAGGEYVRDASGELTGVLLEHAHEAVTARVPNPTLDEMVEAILAACRSMRSYGIVAATDMMTGRYDMPLELEAYRLASEHPDGIAMRLFLQWSRVFGPRKIDPGQLKELTAAMDPLRCRAEGIKIFADGAIGSATAAIYGGYQGGDPAATTSGQLIYTPERLAEMIRVADADGWRIAIHSIGDYSTDLVLNAYEASQDPARHRLEHAMLLSDAQIEHIQRLGCHVTMQPEFLMRFGHAYQRQLGPERSWNLKRMRSLTDAGIELSLNSDRPIVAGDPEDGIRMAVNRPAGFNPAEALTLTEAIDGYTKHAATANGDQGVMGELKPGQLAAFVTRESLPK